MKTGFETHFLDTAFLSSVFWKTIVAFPALGLAALALAGLFHCCTPLAAFLPSAPGCFSGRGLRLLDTLGLIAPKGSRGPRQTQLLSLGRSSCRGLALLRSSLLAELEGA